MLSNYIENQTIERLHFPKENFKMFFDKNVYVIGKNTPNKLKLIYMLGGKEVDEKCSYENFEGELETEVDNCDFTIINVTLEEAKSLKKDKKDNNIYYVYDVDDRETFEQLKSIHPALKAEFHGKFNNRFVYYGIACDIKNERSISFEELMTTANENKTDYFELQEFNMERINENIDSFHWFGSTVYIAFSKQSGYKEVLNEEIKFALKEFEFLKHTFVPISIEEMEPLDEFYEKMKAVGDESSIAFIYSPYSRESFTLIEDYVSKCPNIHNYNNLELHVFENKYIKIDGKEREVTDLEVKRLCKKYELAHEFAFMLCSIPNKKPDNVLRYRKTDDFNLEKYLARSDEDRNLHINCDFTKSGVVDFIDDGHSLCSFFDICFCNLTGAYINTIPRKYNYIIAGDTCGMNGSTLQQNEEYFLNTTKKCNLQHYIRFKKDEFTDVLKQYYELQEPAKETIHIFGSPEIEEVLLDTDVIGFVKDEECRFVRFGNHITKYRIEFHEENEFTRDMKYILCFVAIDDESGIENIVNEMEANETNNFLIFVRNKDNNPKDVEKAAMERIRTKFNEISDKIELFKLVDQAKVDKEVNEFYFDSYYTYEKIDEIFIRLTKGDKQPNEYEGYEGGCCRV